jgi:hypothetical protein
MSSPDSDELIRKRDLLTNRECKKEACAIQDCLEKNHYHEGACRDVIEKWRECRRNALNKAGLGETPEGCC